MSVALSDQCTTARDVPPGTLNIEPPLYATRALLASAWERPLGIRRSLKAPLCSPDLYRSPFPKICVAARVRRSVMRSPPLVPQGFDFETYRRSPLARRRRP